MVKREELSNPQSYMSRAHDDEMTFVLLGRDAAAPVAIRAWIQERLRLGKNLPDDPQITEAQQCATAMASGFRNSQAATEINAEESPQTETRAALATEGE